MPQRITAGVPCILQRLKHWGWARARRNRNNTVHVSVANFLARVPRHKMRYWFALIKRRMPINMRRNIKQSYIRERLNMFRNLQTFAASQIEMHEDVLAVDAQGRIRGEDDPFDMETEA